jgi:hypothetical protein
MDGRSLNPPRVRNVMCSLAQADAALRLCGGIMPQVAGWELAVLLEPTGRNSFRVTGDWEKKGRSCGHCPKCLTGLRLEDAGGTWFPRRCETMAVKGRERSLTVDGLSGRASFPTRSKASVARCLVNSLPPTPVFL